MYLVDTSIWIDYLREKNNKSAQFFLDIIENNVPFGITGVIYQEILQGAASVKDFQELVDYLSTQHFFHPKDDIVTYQAAAKLYFDCRRKGLTVRSTTDCFIAQIAIEHNLILVHNDRDYLQINKINPKLKLYDDV